MISNRNKCSIFLINNQLKNEIIIRINYNG